MVLINCTTKGCLQQTEAKLNRDTGEIICENCGNAIENISPMMARSLNSLGQVLRNKKAQPFQQYCMQCKTNKSLYIKGSCAHCEGCDSQIHITPSFFQGLKTYLENKKKHEDAGVE